MRIAFILFSAGSTVVGCAGRDASDENSIDDGYNNILGFDTTTLAAMSQMNVHTYVGTQRTNLRGLATNKGEAAVAVGVGAAQPDAGRRHRRRVIAMP